MHNDTHIQTTVYKRRRKDKSLIRTMKTLVFIFCILYPSKSVKGTLFLRETVKVMEENPSNRPTNYYGKTKSMWKAIVFQFKIKNEKDSKDQAEEKVFYHHTAKVSKEMKYLSHTLSKFIPYLLK